MQLTGYAPAVLVAILITPSTGSLSAAGAAPTNDRAIVSQVGALSASGVAPSLNSQNFITPTVGSLTATGIDCVKVADRAIRPTVGSISTAGVAPITLRGSVRLPVVGALTGTGRAPIVTSGGAGSPEITPTVGELTTSGVEPIVYQSYPITTGTGHLYFGIPPASYEITPEGGAISSTGQSPTISSLTETAIQPTTGTLAATGQLPVVGTSKRITPSVGSLTLTGTTPTRYPSVYSDGVLVATFTGTGTPTSYRFESGQVSETYTITNTVTVAPINECAISLVTGGVAGFWYAIATAINDLGESSPSGELYFLVISRSASITPSVGALASAGVAPSAVVSGRSITPSVGAITAAGILPLIGTGIVPACGSLASVGSVSTLEKTGPVDVTPLVGSLGLVAGAPAVASSGDQYVAPSTGALSATGVAGAVDRSSIIQPVVGTLSAGEIPPDLYREYFITPTSGGMGLSGTVPTFTPSGDTAIRPNAGSLVTTGTVGTSFFTGMCPVKVTPTAPTTEQEATEGTPMSRVALRQSIQLRLGDPDGVFMPDTEANDLIQEAQEIMAEHGPPVMRRVGIPIQAYRTYYRLTEFAADAMAPVRIYYPGRTAPLEPTTQEELDAKVANWTAMTGAPSQWFSRGWDQFGVFPKSESDGGFLWVDYLAWPQVLLHDGAESEFGPEDREAIIAYGWYDGVLLSAQTDAVKPAWENFTALLKAGTERRANLTTDRSYKLQGPTNG